MVQHLITKLCSSKAIIALAIGAVSFFLFFEIQAVRDPGGSLREGGSMYIQNLIKVSDGS